MEINALLAFLAVAETGSFSRAAERLFLTQPAVSKRIAALEQELGSPLFDRIGRRVALTEAGRALLPRVRRILDELEDSRRAIGNLTDQVAGSLAIGTSHHIGLHRLPPVLRAFHRAHPAVKLDIQFLDSEEVCRAVESGRLELGIVTLPPEIPPQLEASLLWEDPLTVVAAPDHPLASLHSLTPERLAAHEAILPARGTYTRQVVEAAFAVTGVHLRVALSTNYLETIKMLVSVGLGWSILPATMVDDTLAGFPLPGVTLQRALGRVHHQGRTLSNAARALLTMLDHPDECISTADEV